jgi:serine/threonine-protein kinase
VTLIVLAAAVWGYLFFLGGPAYERLAVLPPTNLMNDPEQEYFVQGVHTALISELQRAGVAVIARTSVMRYENTEKLAREIAQELDVDALVELSVFRVGDSVETEVQLVDGGTEQYVGEPITRGGQLRDVMTLYRNLSRAIASEIQATLTPQAEAILASAREVDPQVYEAYLRGQFHFERLTPSSLEAALEWYERALQRDSTYALAYVGIANVWGARAMMGTESIREAHLQSSTAVRKAWELDSTLAEVQGTAASIRMSQEWDWAGAETAYRRVIELNPNDPVARQSYANLLAILGRPEEARAEMDRAVALDPSNGLVRLFNGTLFMSERRYEDAVAEYRRARELGSFGIIPVWDALDLMGAYAEAFAELRRWVAEVTEDEEVLDGLDRGYAEGGYRAACRRVADILAARSAATSAVWVGSYSVASWYASAREKERTLEWLERAYEEHIPNMPWVGADPLNDFVREEPRFQALLRRMNLPQR